MNTSKIIKGVVGGGRYTVTAPIIKEDYGLYLQIEGIELPETYEVDFSNDEHSGTSVTMIGNADGVLIPSQFISSGKDIFAFLYHVGENYGRTVFKFRIPNKLRPDRTDEEPTPEQASTIDQTITALNTAVAKTAQDVVDADASAQRASEFAEDARDAEARAAARAATAKNHADRAEQARDDAQTYADNASASAQASAQSAQSAEQSAQTASEKADSITGLTAQATTLPDGSSATASYNAETGVMSFGIPKGKDGTNGTNGDDGYSPTANVSKTGKTATITITDQNGTTSAQVEDGTDGTDGVSPTVTITPITGGHRITITDADGSHSADVMDGTGSVDDVQINGQSIVQNGVANVPVASANNIGLVKIFSGNGIYIDGNNDLAINRAADSQIKNGAASYRPIVPICQHQSAFYGLAKSAGDTTQSQSSNAVGTYTEEAKIAIQKMLGIYEAPWELIREDTFTNAEEADHIIDVDANGESFELTDVVLELIVPTHDEDTTHADFCRVYLYNQNTLVSTVFLWNGSSKTITANSAVNMAIASVTQDNGLMRIEINQWGTRTQRSNKQIVLEEGLGTTAPYRINSTHIDSIKISRVTGLMKYRLYGCRKWQ